MGNVYMQVVIISSFNYNMYMTSVCIGRNNCGNQSMWLHTRIDRYKAEINLVLFVISDFTMRLSDNKASRHFMAVQNGSATFLRLARGRIFLRTSIINAAPCTSACSFEFWQDSPTKVKFPSKCEYKSLYYTDHNLWNLGRVTSFSEWRSRCSCPSPSSLP